MKIPKINNKFSKIVIGIVIMFVLIIVSWMVVETTVEITSVAFFCNTCHAMEPMVSSYHDSIHGGDSPLGIMAACTDCHVSHENVFTHFVGKAKSGTHDIWVNVTTDTTKIDWAEKRLEREEYVYDSGCLTCHQNLEAATQGEEHENYFMGITDSKCVTCHEEVGHSNINKYLLESKYK